MLIILELLTSTAATSLAFSYSGLDCVKECFVLTLVPPLKIVSVRLRFDLKRFLFLFKFTFPKALYRSTKLTNFVKPEEKEKV